MAVIYLAATVGGLWIIGRMRRRIVYPSEFRRLAIVFAVSLLLSLDLSILQIFLEADIRLLVLLSVSLAYITFTGIVMYISENAYGHVTSWRNIFRRWRTIVLYILSLFFILWFVVSPPYYDSVSYDPVSGEVVITTIYRPEFLLLFLLMTLHIVGVNLSEIRRIKRKTPSYKIRKLEYLLLGCISLIIVGIVVRGLPRIWGYDIAYLQHPINLGLLTLIFSSLKWIVCNWSLLWIHATFPSLDIVEGGSSHVVISEVNRMRIILKYIADGLMQDEAVILIVRNEEDLKRLRREGAKYGIDIEGFRDRLQIYTSQEVYRLRENHLDTKFSSNWWINKVKSLNKNAIKGVRFLIDLDKFRFIQRDRIEEYLEYVEIVRLILMDYGVRMTEVRMLDDDVDEEILRLFDKVSLKRLEFGVRREAPIMEVLGRPLEKVTGKSILIEYTSREDVTPLIAKISREAYKYLMPVVLLIPISKLRSHMMESNIYRRIFAFTSGFESLKTSGDKVRYISIAEPISLVHTVKEEVEKGTRGSAVMIINLLSYMIATGYDREMILKVTATIIDTLTAKNWICILLLNKDITDAGLKGLIRDLFNIILEYDGERLREIKIEK